MLTKILLSVIKEIAHLTITENFDSALGIYLASKIFDLSIGLRLIDYVKNKVEVYFGKYFRRLSIISSAKQTMASRPPPKPKGNSEDTSIH